MLIFFFCLIIQGEQLFKDKMHLYLSHKNRKPQSKDSKDLLLRTLIICSKRLLLFELFKDCVG